MDNKKKADKDNVKHDPLSDQKHNDILIRRNKYNILDTMKRTPDNMKKNGVIDL